MPQYTRLCLNGGGVRGALQVGALTAYADIVGTRKLHTVFVDGVYGISIGSIICSFLAFGFDIDDVTGVLHKLTVTELIEEPRLQNILDFSSRKGLDTGEKIHRCLKDIFSEKGMDFDRLTVGDALVPLHIIASDLTKCKTVVFCDTVRVWDAIRASISLPLVFTPHTIKGRVFVDGAVICNDVLSQVPPQYRAGALVLLCSNIRSENIQNADALTFMNCVLGARTNAVVQDITKKYPENVCLLTENSTSMLDPNPDKESLVLRGYTLGRAFFAKCVDKECSVG